MYKPIENEQLSEGEAWSLVKKAIQDGIYHSEERFNELPEVVQKAVGSANMIYQWAQTDSDEVNTVVMSNFQRTYRAVVQRQAFENKIPKQLADAVKGIAEKKPDKPLLNDFNNFDGRKYDYAQLEKEAFGEQ